MTDKDLGKLINAARAVPITPADRDKQRRSFAYGNTKTENDRITRRTIDKAARRLKSGDSGGGSKK